MTRVSSKNPQDPQDATSCALNARYIEHTSQTVDVWVVESDIYDYDILDPDGCFMLLVFFTLGVPLFSIVFFAYVNHALAEA